jgi:hypothetical protein
MFRITAMVVVLPLVTLVIPLVFLAAWLREMAADWRPPPVPVRLG